MAGLIVQEWIEESGGAEQVLDALRVALPDSRVACLWNDDTTRFPPSTVDESWMARTPLRGRKALALPDDVRHLAPGLGRRGTRLGGHEQLRLRAPRRVRHEARGAEVLVRAHARPLPVGARPRQPHVGAPRGTGAGLPPRRRPSRGGVLRVARREQRVRARSHPPRVGPRRPCHPPARRRGGHRRGARLGRAHDARRASAPRVAPRPRLPHGGVTARAVQAPRRGHPHGGGARPPGRRRRLRPRARAARRGRRRRGGARPHARAGLRRAHARAVPAGPGLRLPARRGLRDHPGRGDGGRMPRDREPRRRGGGVRRRRRRRRALRPRRRRGVPGRDRPRHRHPARGGARACARLRHRAVRGRGARLGARRASRLRPGRAPGRTASPRPSGSPRTSRRGDATRRSTGRATAA